MPGKLDFYFDFVSPFSYLAHQALPALAERHGYKLDYRPIDLREVRLTAGNTGPMTRDQPLKLAYARQDQRRWAERYGVPITPPRSHDWSQLTRGAFFAIDRNEAQRYVAHVWHKIWGEGGAMDDALIRSVAQAMGWDAAAFLSFTASPAAEARYRASTKEAHARGIFGVPTMMVGDEMWWGNDRLDFLDEYLRARPG
jgi:2-hydroxychromene-2-carboxylate isomerase